MVNLKNLEILDSYKMNKRGELEIEFSDNSRLLAIPIKDSDDNINGFSVMGLYRKGVLEAVISGVDNNHCQKISFWSKGSVNNTEFFSYWNSVYNKFSEDISLRHQETDKKLSKSNIGFLRAFYGFGKNARDDLSKGDINIKKYKPRELPERFDF